MSSKAKRITKQKKASPQFLSERIVNKWVSEFLDGMGEPEPQPFVPSDFQADAVNAVIEQDTIVIAPTGSGKTWIAEQAITRFLSEGRRSWYTTPLKALSNQKYDALRELFGEQTVGLLTGERRENSQAQVIVATTEVLRNLLYSSMNEITADFVVLDEAHYISDPERGVTWEEVVILAPKETRLLLLSATIANAEELSGWMKEVRGQKPALILVDDHHRPVPLRYGFLDQLGRPIYLDVIDSVSQKVLYQFLWHFIHPVDILNSLRRYNLLPAIIFLPRRRDCDEAVKSFGKYRLNEGLQQRRAMFEEIASQLPRLWEHPFSRYLIDAGIAPHHAGHLTSWKIAVEKMLRAGLLKAVFATTTLAAGLDVPARTVVLPTLRVRDERGERTLTALEFHQMTGRAGRRSKDKIGFVLIIPRRKTDFNHGMRLVKSKPEDLQSAFRVQYYQVLNLLSNHSYEEALSILDRSLAVYQMAQRSHRKARSIRQELRTDFKRRAELLHKLGYLTDDWKLTEVGRWGLLIRHERSLFIVEAVRQGLMDTLSLSELAGWAAAFTTERSPRFPVAHLNLKPLSKLAYELEMMENQYKLKPSLFTYELDCDDAYHRATAVFRWAEGKMDWETLVFHTGSEEGDLQRLILQSAEVLRQLEDLPSLISERAYTARLSLLREPVVENWQFPT